MERRQVAEHFAGYLPFATDVTPWIRGGGDNLVVRNVYFVPDEAYFSSNGVMASAQIW